MLRKGQCDTHTAFQVAVTQLTQIVDELMNDISGQSRIVDGIHTEAVDGIHQTGSCTPPVHSGEADGELGPPLVCRI